MAHVTETKFADIQNDERCQKLKRALKLALLRKQNKQDRDESYMLPMTPISISSINMDGFDSTTNFLQASRIGSEVVSSSNNLRNMILKGNDKNGCKPIATSSVKKFNTKTDSDKDYLLMPPPNFDCVPSTFKKSNDITTTNDARIQSVSENDTIKETPEHDNICSSNMISDIVQNRKVKVFKDWKVMFNGQGQLVIKGRIERGIIARSKPIIRRLTSTIVESICKHLYQLQGNIVDNEYELPDYVINKFSNGFPDDWLNVCDIWRAFIDKGCKTTFRWPTNVTDSDDDLRSEITDMTFVGSNSPENKGPKSLKEPRTLRSATSNVLQALTEKENNSPCKTNMSNSFTQTSISGTCPVTWLNNDKENCKQQDNTASNCFYSEDERNKLRDKLNLIINTLTDKNDSKTCLNIISELLDWIHHIISNEADENDKSNIKNSRSSSNKSSNSKEYCPSESIPLQNIIVFDRNKSATADSLTNCNNSSQINKTFNSMNRTNGSSSSDSESSVYAGVRKISVTQILHRKRPVIESPKRKIKRSIAHRKSKKSSVKSPTKTQEILTKNNSRNHEDSSISIIEDNEGCLKYKKHIDPSNERNVSVKPSAIKGNQWDKTNVHTNNKTYKVREHFMQKNVYRDTESNNEVMEGSSCIEASRKRGETMKCQCQKCASHEQTREQLFRSREFINKVSKPDVISSVPVVNTVDVTNFSINPKGENVCIKQNNSACPTSRDSLMVAMYDSPNKSKNVNKSLMQGNDVSKKNTSNGSKNNTASPPEKSGNAKTIENLKEFESNRQRKILTRKKRRIVEHASELSDFSDNTSVPVQKKQKVKAKQQELSDSAVTTNEQDNLGNTENMCKSCLDVGPTKSIPKSTIPSPCRTRQMSKVQQEFSAVNRPNIVCTYHNNISVHSVLSADEDSHV
ncbi:uncharacterized protein LOC128886614 isoform X1 [Hylaeus anthracinus]|uniref:uncharacterized protein LOC128886614 isoform X1 n=2 Tax=Hylaeus anthracinus TaxID=313031 RepID=UPI0023B918CE|nr:uncharacterized protein LOC128886614 isoform X1 [Hylaeus anthracinus]